MTNMCANDSPLHLFLKYYPHSRSCHFVHSLWYSEVRLINRFTIVNQVAQSLVLIQEAIPASCADYNLAALYFYTYILYI